MTKNIYIKIFKTVGIHFFVGGTTIALPTIITSAGMFLWKRAIKLHAHTAIVFEKSQAREAKGFFKVLIL